MVWGRGRNGLAGGAGEGYIRAQQVTFQPSGAMIEVLWRGGVFALFTFIVYLVCMWFVRVEERRENRR